MRCRSNRHEWAAASDALRCCSGCWRREVRVRGTEGDLDPEGRAVVPVGPVVLIYGWVPVAAPPLDTIGT